MFDERASGARETNVGLVPERIQEILRASRAWITAKMESTVREMWQEAVEEQGVTLLARRVDERFWGFGFSSGG